MTLFLTFMCVCCLYNSFSFTLFSNIIITSERGCSSITTRKSDTSFPDCRKHCPVCKTLMEITEDSKWYFAFYRFLYFRMVPISIFLNITYSNTYLNLFKRHFRVNRMISTNNQSNRKRYLTIPNKISYFKYFGAWVIRSVLL